MSSDLFAGLSLNPTALAASPPKASEVSRNGTDTNGVSKEASTTELVNNDDSQFEEFLENFSAPTETTAPDPVPLVSTTTTPERITRAPATDKLLGLLGTPSSSPQVSRSAPPPPPPPAALAQKSPLKKETVPATPTSPAVPSSLVPKSTGEGAAAVPVTPVSPAKQPPRNVPTSPPSKNKIATDEVLTAFSMDSQPTVSPLDASNIADPSATPRPKPSLRGMGTVVSSTPIPHEAVALRIFQKFASRVEASIPESHGGKLRRSIIGYLFGSTSIHDAKYDAYKSWSEAVKAEDANTAVACFCHILGVWGHASAHMAELESKTSAAYQHFGQNLGIALDTATALVTRGCLDGVEIEAENIRKPAVDVICEAVFASDTSHARVELSAMKFLLSTGCRVYPSLEGQQAMLRGTHLLQSIRVLYHVYLTTESNANKTTARASLQQLVTSVFIRMIAASARLDDKEQESTHHEVGDEAKSTDFPTEDHRDAFLVLRSLCKLSMRNPPNNLHSHIGLQAGNSNTTWDAQNTATNPSIPVLSPSTSSVAAAESHKADGPSLIYTQAIHPALESKILALDLLLYVLQHTDMKGDYFVQRSGTQFHYAIRSYLCVSLLKNCTSDDTRVVSLSLRVFVPIIRNFRALLKTEIEAFVTNVFFVILDSKNSPMEHKNLVVTLFEEICSDPQTLAEIFLNYDCDLSAVDLFHRIVNTLGKVARSMEIQTESTSILGSGTARMEKARSAQRQLRLEAMKALRQVLASLHGSIVKPMWGSENTTEVNDVAVVEEGKEEEAEPEKKKNLVEIYGSKKKRQEEESEIFLRFNQKPSAGLAYAAKCGHLDGSDHNDVARFLLANKDKLDTTQIGEYLGREPEYQGGFAVKVLHGYVNSMDFEGLVFDDAIRHYLSGFRLPGEAQKIDRIMEKFAERFTAQNPDVFPSADVAFILAFSIIMLNTDLHNPAIKEERRMTKDGFIRNNRGICDGQDLPREMLLDIFDRIKSNPISLKEDDEARQKVGQGSGGAAGIQSAISPAAFFTSSYEDLDRTKETNFIKERDQIVKTTESLLRRKRHANSDSGKQGRKTLLNSPSSKSHHIRYVRTEDSGLRDEYVSPMFEVTWGPALAAFSTAMESANGTVGALLAIATDEELEAAATNAAETIEVCLAGFRFAICTAGLCGNDVARDAYMLALTRFSQLGTGTFLEPRHIRCAQTILTLARYNGELLGSSWEHAFLAMSEINRFHQLFQLLARNDKAIAVAAERRRARLQEREHRLRARKARRAAKESNENLDDGSLGESTGDLSLYDDSDIFSDSSDHDFGENMNTKEIDEANAKTVYEAISEGLIQAIYERSSSLSTAAVKEFVHQLCRVSHMEISGNWQAGADAGSTQVQYRERHTLLGDTDSFYHHQTNIYSLQKLVEVTHYNMDSRPRLVFAELWIPVSDHLTTTALHSNPAVAMYAVDSIRQLSIQYLQREELGAFEFQRRFLKPLEIVMSKSTEHMTKELLLKCVERLILMFGSPSEGQTRRGMLRSGWRPVLTVLGLAGRDRDAEIAKLGFSVLSAQLEPIVAREKSEKNGRDKSRHGVLLDERFVDLVDALLIYVDGPHEEMSLQALDHLVTLSSFLADESFALPLIRRRGVTRMSPEEAGIEGGTGPENQELELWWPVLLGISKAIGDDRKHVRVKSLKTLSTIILTHLFPTPASVEDDQKKARQVQLLQLIFRGILMPVLEFAEMEVSGARPPALPSDFDRFLTGPNKTAEGKAAQKSRESWLDTTFDQFMDACIGICLKAGEAFGDDTLLEEVFAMLNSCMISDSGALAVRGLRRLELLLTGDLKPNKIDDDTWATVSHMLRRTLAVRSLPKARAVVSGSVDGEMSEAETERLEAVREFIMEDNFLANRRYLGSNAVMVIASFLGSERFVDSLGLRWRLFLISGVGKAIRDWEYASSLVDDNTYKTKVPTASDPPSYLETAFYSRKHMNRFLLQIVAKKDIAPLAAEGSREAAAQALVKEQTYSLVTIFLKKEARIAANKASPLDMKLFERWTGLVRDMFAAYDMIPEEQLALMAWLDPALMPCIATNTESIRLAIQRLTKKLHGTPGAPVEQSFTTPASVETPSNPEADGEGTTGNTDL